MHRIVFHIRLPRGEFYHYDAWPSVPFALAVHDTVEFGDQERAPVIEGSFGVERVQYSFLVINYQSIAHQHVFVDARDALAEMTVKRILAHLKEEKGRGSC